MADLLLKRLEEIVSKNPSKIALSFLGPGANGGKLETQLTYQQVEDETNNLAMNLLNSGLQKGDLAVLVYPPSVDFAIAFLACLKAGIVAVPVFPPHPARRDTLIMFTKIVDECGAKFALTSANYNHLKKLSSLKDAFSRFKKKTNSTSWPDSLTWIATDSLKSSNPKGSASLPTQPVKSDLAFLQFTSGSTSDPKGVMITHGNLGDNLTKITTELEAGNDTIVVSWLPQYHDMGLIGSYLGTLYCGGSGYYMSPLAFLQRPGMWIEAISKYRGTHLQSPNFALKLTAKKFDKSSYSQHSLDLSSVRHIINAAEPVTEDSIESFCNAFCSFGLNRGVIYPTYGLAEHTVFVCSGGKQRITVSKHALEVNRKVEIVEKSNGDNDPTSRLVGCGYPEKQNVDVKIIDTESYTSLDEGNVGEVWIRSESKAAGYFKKPLESKRDFCAEIGVVTPPSEDNDKMQSEGYLKTGDLGFLYNKELFICGRIKDLIIVGGRNYYPQDLEVTAEGSDPRIRPGCSAAFTIDPISGNDEKVALILELRDVPDSKDVEDVCSKLTTALKGAVMQEHSLSLSHIVILRPRTVPKTTSGKIARTWCRRAFIENKLNSIYVATFNDDKKLTSSFEIDQDNPVNGAGGRSPVNPETIRSLDKKEIMTRLKSDISRVVSMPPASIPGDTDLATMMDSLTLSQFKGLLEGKYATQLSDEYLFSEGLNLSKLVEIVKLGYAPDDNAEPGEPGATSPATTNQKAGGVAGALGCPAHFICAIM
eukprot:CAMPEP_0194124154 /NCGR_PEP_ID=MMETSP0150-20130528/57438_1 /TAXON_ID=122233 /ORGANISM="Chaetoceros debilis, Strain MM31A-1" /LENGTH=762 /DNA_ID=CAMNT_0038817741 /DNA_START=36 /DNA_END=2324 /DNA_ORIENTATION=+